MAKYDNINFAPPQGVRRACARGLELHKDGLSGDGLEAVTVAWARKFAAGEKCSPEKARQGNRWFGRNSRFAKEPKDSPAYVSYLLWGGRAGKGWFSKLVRQMNAADEGEKQMSEVSRKSYAASDIKALDQGIVEAIVSVFNNTDRQKEVVKPGCFSKSLMAKKPKGVWAHDWTKPIAKTLEARELMPGDPLLPESLKAQGGLYIKGQFNLNTQRGKEAYEDLKFGTIDEFSIGFRVTKDSYETKSGVRMLEEGELYEWSPVLVGANPSTRMLSIKSDAPLPELTEDDLATEAKGYYQAAQAEQELGDDIWKYVHALSRGLHEMAEDAADGEVADPATTLRETLMAFVNDIYAWMLPLLRQASGNESEAEGDGMATPAGATAGITPGMNPMMKSFMDLKALSLAGGDFKSHSELVLAAVQEYAKRAGEIASLRAKAGRQISAANRDRLMSTCSSIQSAMEGMTACHADLMALANADQPKGDGEEMKAAAPADATDELKRKQLEQLRLRARVAA